MAETPDYAYAEELNRIQKTLESSTDWAEIEATLRAEAAARDVAYDPSDLEGIRRNAGYDVQHLGDPAKYAAAIESSLQNAIGNYNQRSENTPGDGSTDNDDPIAPGTPISPVPVASLVTTLGASSGANTAPTVGPIGLAYPADPVNYATGQTGARYGYSAGSDDAAIRSGNYPTATTGTALLGGGSAAGAAGADNTMIYVILAGLAVGAYLLLRKK